MPELLVKAAGLLLSGIAGIARLGVVPLLMASYAFEILLEDRLKSRRPSVWSANRRSDAALLWQQVHLRRDQAYLRQQFESERVARILATRRKSLKHKWRTFDDQFGGRSERVWVFGQFLFCHKTRREIYDPFVEELREDLFLALAKCTTLGEMRWVRFCIALRTTALISYCIWTSGGEAVRGLLQAVFKHWGS